MSILNKLTNAISLPDWLSKDELKLPPWAKVDKNAVSVITGRVSICIELDTDGYVKYWLSLLGNPEPDQYWLEVAYQCAKLDIQRALIGTKYDPRISGVPVEIHMSKSPQWALNRFRQGRGVKAASKHFEAREHYRRIRGSLPM